MTKEVAQAERLAPGLVGTYDLAVELIELFFRLDSKSRIIENTVWQVSNLT